MVYRIETMDSIQLMGKAERQFIGNVQANIFWNKCKQDGTLTQLTTRSTSLDKELIGLADSSSYDGKSYLYYVATPFDGETISDGFTIINLPASLWIKFKYSSFVLDTADKDIWTYIYSDFFPASKYEPSEYQLEVYPCGDGNYSGDISEIWISAKIKA
ncbi:GyrI-like domain-containing protein [Candidatus Enterococcus murrayae]|uniref:GyrI-like domain-containing protein n=1 Tax=Candidatus Enterococcus murrayae TaxID=2815321 RepID=A0ABS3HJQ5_9ENTE|nr:GyrI-like domain-containing protein [Enterococcus sp. MJM16]MBO0453242.1 GyrI-like domain-containing protein [Enterococcus sp. MJM16]